MRATRVLCISLLVSSLAASAAAASGSDVADAAMRGDHAAIRALLAQHADVNAPQADGSTALHWAVYRGDEQAAEWLVGAGANVAATNRLGVTPLWMASLYGYPALVDALVKAGANVDQRSPAGETALMLASRNGNAAVIARLLEAGADVNARDDLRGTTPLMWAADQGHAAALKFLIDHGADVAARSKTEATVQTLLVYQTAKLKGNSLLAKRFAARPGNHLEDHDPGGGALTPLAFAVRRNAMDAVRVLLTAGADINSITGEGWSPLLIAIQNRYYRLAIFLLDHGADPNIANHRGWTPLYIAVDNRNIEHGDYPWRKPDMDHLDVIKALLDHRANVNARGKDNTWTRTVFTDQWLFEDGATPFLRASQSSDLVLMRMLLARGADPKIPTTLNVTALMVASGIGWVEGVTHEWSERDNIEAVKLCLDLGLDPSAAGDDGRTALHGAAHKGRSEVVQLLVDHGAKLDARDNGSVGSSNRGGKLAGHQWLPIDYADGLIRIGTQSPIPHPETAALIHQLMVKQGLPAPPTGRTLETVCDFEACGD
jgi:ankyrin repeat protein